MLARFENGYFLEVKVGIDAWGFHRYEYNVLDEDGCEFDKGFTEYRGMELYYPMNEIDYILEYCEPYGIKGKYELLPFDTIENYEKSLEEDSDREMSKVDAHIILYADDYSYDVWEDYCNICGVSSSANSICIGFDYVNVEETVQCSCCGENIKESEVKLKTFEDGEDYICSECLENFGKCESCEIYFPREDLYAHAGGVMCADCYDEAERCR